MILSEQIAQWILERKKAGPFLAAIDGVDASGKTTLADAVAAGLHAQGKNAVRVSIDHFHNPAAIRARRGALSPEGFFYDSFDLEALQACVIQPVRENRGSILSGIYDDTHKSRLAPDPIPVTDDLLVILDGIFLHRDELFACWDFSIFLDVSFETVLKRAAQRDQVLFGSPEAVIERYRQKYIPGQQLYLAACRPQDRASAVVDNNGWDHPVIIKWPDAL